MCLLKFSPFQSCFDLERQSSCVLSEDLQYQLLLPFIPYITCVTFSKSTLCSYPAVLPVISVSHFLSISVIFRTVIHCPLFYASNSISLQSYLTDLTDTWLKRFRSSAQLIPGPHRKPFNRRYHTQILFLLLSLLFWCKAWPLNCCHTTEFSSSLLCLLELVIQFGAIPAGMPCIADQL